MKLLVKKLLAMVLELMGNNTTYSTAEKRVGTWIDGKPLYRKVLTGTTPSGAMAGYDLFAFPSNAIIRWWDIVVQAAGENATSFRGQSESWVRYIGNTIAVSASNPTYYGCPCCCTILYTKTTD